MDYEKLFKVCLKIIVVNKLINLYPDFINLKDQKT